MSNAPLGAPVLRKDMPSVRWLEPFFRFRDKAGGGGPIHWEDVGTGADTGTGGNGIQFGGTGPVYGATNTGQYLSVETTALIPGGLNDSIRLYSKGDIEIQNTSTDNTGNIFVAGDSGVGISGGGDEGVVVETKGSGDLLLRVSDQALGSRLNFQLNHAINPWIIGGLQTVAPVGGTTAWVDANGFLRLGPGSGGGGGATGATLTLVFDGGGVGLALGYAGDVQIPFAATIKSWTLLADQTGSVVIDIWKDVYANYPPTVADTITASALPQIVSGLKATDSTLTGWNKTINAGDTLRFNINSTSGIHQVTLILDLN